MIAALKSLSEAAYWRSLRFWHPKYANDNYPPEKGL